MLSQMLLQMLLQTLARGTDPACLTVTVSSFSLQKIQQVERAWAMLIKTIGQTLTLTSQTKDYHALKNAPYPKVVCSTNVAESSVTITGVNMVIDLGKCKSVVVQPQTQITELKPEDITKASAIQRGGRAA